jgi:hypothetical protein
MSYIFSVAFMANMLSMTAMLIFFSMAGQSHMAADIGIVQASTSALFYAFSANARNIVLSTSTSTLAKSIFNIRVILLAPLVFAAFWMSSILGGVESLFASVLIIRRAVEWFGEVDLSERERTGDNKFALEYVLVQAFLFVFAALWLLMKMPYPLLGLFFWAFLPAFLSIKFFWSAWGCFANAILSINKRIAPHFGSSLAIGVSLYVFRLLIILILGKNVSGDLFAAFAIGGVLGSIFVSAFGPSIVFNEKMNGTFKLPKLLVLLLWCFFSLGLLIVGFSFLKSDFFPLFGKDSIYWKAIGYSMIGGVVMVHAQLLRNRLLIHNEHHDLFGPDLLMNMLVIAAVPLAYFLIGIEAVAGLSLVGALLAFVFYKSSEFTEILRQNEYAYDLKRLQVFVALFVLMPIFITLDSGIFLSKVIPLTGGISLMLLPIPISILLVFIAILMIGSYRSVHLSLSVVFFSFILMIFSTLIVSTNQGALEQTKIILIIQCILPMIALVLGEMFKTEGMDAGKRIERVFLFVLTLIIPLQLAASWIQGSLYLTGYLYVFSIYQHVQYVPIIFVSAYLLSIFSLWQDSRYRRTLLFMVPLMGIYVAASLSFIAITFLIVGVFIFAILRWHLASEKLPACLFFTVLVLCLGYLNLEVSIMTAMNKYNYIAVEIVKAWQHYLAAICDSVKVLFLGHVGVIDKLKFPNVYNYYLDMVYNFGIIAIIPLLVVFGYTVRVAYLAKRNFFTNSALLGHLFVLFFLLVIDNSTQVSLRQPYSGVFTFFIWGLLIARLSKINIIKNN